MAAEIACDKSTAREKLTPENYARKLYLEAVRLSVKMRFGGLQQVLFAQGPHTPCHSAHPSTVRHNDLADVLLLSQIPPGSPTIFPGPLPDLSWIPPRRPAILPLRLPLGFLQDRFRPWFSGQGANSLLKSKSVPL